MRKKVARLGLVLLAAAALAAPIIPGQPACRWHQPLRTTVRLP